MKTLNTENRRFKPALGLPLKIPLETPTKFKIGEPEIRVEEQQKRSPNNIFHKKLNESNSIVEEKKNSLIRKTAKNLRENTE